MTINVLSNPEAQDRAIGLSEIVERAIADTGAHGAAVAVQQQGLLLTAASSGECAPDFGVPVRDGSFAGRCFEEGVVLICSDAETDDRVDAAACRSLQVRSMVAVPIRKSEALLGVLAVFSEKPNHFQDGEVERTKMLAGQAGEILGHLSVTESPAKPVEVSPATPLFTTGQQCSTRRPLWAAIGVAAALLLVVNIPGIRLLKVKAAHVDKMPPPMASTATDGQGVSVPSPNLVPEKTIPDSTGGVAAMESQSNLHKVTAGNSVPESEPMVVIPATGVRSSLPQSSSNTKPDPSNAPVFDLVPPKLVREVLPIYPQSAMGRGAEGKVVINAVVLPDGTVGKVTVVSGAPQLREAAITAVKGSLYEPAYLNGRPTEAKVAVQVNFPAQR